MLLTGAAGPLNDQVAKAKQKQGRKDEHGKDDSEQGEHEAVPSFVITSI